MFDIITKRDLWRALDAKRISDKAVSLKEIQDAYILHTLGGVTGAKILELGGGKTRVLPRLAAWGNECWNADKLEGVGNGPDAIAARGDGSYRVVQTYLGDFSHELPESYFDFIVSVSAVEHTPLDRLADMFADCARCLKPGGKMVHAIDLYMFDADYRGPGRTFSMDRITGYLTSFRRTPSLSFIEAPVLRDATFRCEYATNSDFELYRWNQVAKGRVTDWRAIGQNCSIKAQWRKA